MFHAARGESQDPGYGTWSKGEPCRPLDEVLSGAFAKMDSRTRAVAPKF